MSKITNQLYLGGAAEAKNKRWLKDHGVTHIINCSIEHDNYYPSDFVYLSLNLYDDPRQTLYGVLEIAYRFLTDAIFNGGTVFVHCHAGVSRSASIVIYYMMKTQRWSYIQAFQYVKSKRDIINPNQGFARQLVSVSPQAINTSPSPAPALRKYRPDYSRPQMIESRGRILQKALGGASQSNKREWMSHA